ncbi:BGLF5 [Phascolarctid gammaherpesvirus 1]|uniref:BGLF5 n=1 Tax=Phascolarctid gammaherpesvirus 1 TaxID=2249313 RepID=A0A3Q8J768_9GAMA|nr:BGLF5 [Phascolarctid gammaherpesvirus 1]AZB49209.1 BGLF5 [Phascolarctid gammaherpesvirus 1]
MDCPDLTEEWDIIDYVGDQDIDRQLMFISNLTFTNFLKTEAVEHYVMQYGRVEMPFIRYAYLYYLMKKLGPFQGNTEYTTFFETICKRGNRSFTEVYTSCRLIGPYAMTKLCLILESMTREQSYDYLWAMLRHGTISSTKLHQTLKPGKHFKIFEPRPLNTDFYTGGALAFGLRSEPIVKQLINSFVLKGTGGQQVGFLMSPLDGIFGVSLDMCSHVNSGEDGLVFQGNSVIYEIKSRYKYLFRKMEYDCTYKAYRELYDNPTKRNFIHFITSIPKAAVEFVEQGRVPTENDYLLTHDPDWDVCHKKRRRLLKDSVVSRDLYYNQHITSRVIILSDPSLEDGSIYIKSELQMPLYVNPRHSYFFQLMLQYKVVKNLIQTTSTRQFLNSTYPGTNIVTAFFRKRESSDPTTCYINNTAITPSEIPVILLITPVAFPHDSVLTRLKTAVKSWSSEAEDIVPATAPWAPDALVARGDMTP